MSCKVYWITLGVLIKGRSLGGVTEPTCFIRRARRRFLYGRREQLADREVKWWRKSELLARRTGTEEDKGNEAKDELERKTWKRDKEETMQVTAKMATTRCKTRS